jgi:hypothetical protein
MRTVPICISRCLLILLLAAGLSWPVSADTEEGEEGAIKTAFLFNFFKFINWPLEVSLATLDLCTIYNDQLGDSLAVLENKFVGDRLLLVRRNLEVHEIKDCHLVYISSSVEKVEAILKQVKGLPIVTVSDQVDFIAHGGMIGLVHDNDRLSFEINLDVAKAQGIHISAQLLRLAKVVDTAK